MTGIFIYSCKKKIDQPADESPAATPIELHYPSYFPSLIIPPDNPMTKEGVFLGRTLYYDEKISTNGPHQGQSCSSCHHQELSFSIPASGTSVLPHVNLGWNNNFLWDGMVSGTMEDIMRFEAEDFFKVDLNVLKNDPSYPALFKKAFGSEEVTYEKISMALSQFFRVMISFDSEFDRVILQQGLDTYSDDEADGYLIFFTERGDCFHCHTTPLMTDNSFRNIGLESVFSGANMGRYNVTQNPADVGKFKTPTLRNIALTGPYMHDGRFSTLEEVVEHYNSGVKISATLDPIMTKPGKEFGLKLSAKEKASLVAFLKTLTDSSFIENPELSSPF